MPEDPFSPFDKIREAIQRTIEPFGLEFVGWQLLTDQRACSVVLRIKSEAFLSDQAKEDRKVLEKLEEETLAYEARERLAEETERIREELTQNIGAGGLFSDSPEE